MKNWQYIILFIALTIAASIGGGQAIRAIVYNPIELPICPYTQEKAEIIATSGDDKLRIYVCETGQ